MQGTIENLKDIVQRNQDKEAAHIVRQIELTLADIERKTRNRTTLAVAPLTVQTVPVS